jgi:hypothetical protein
MTHMKFPGSPVPDCGCRKVDGGEVCTPKGALQKFYASYKAMGLTDEEARVNAEIDLQAAQERQQR